MLNGFHIRCVSSKRALLFTAARGSTSPFVPHFLFGTFPSPRVERGDRIRLRRGGRGEEIRVKKHSLLFTAARGLGGFPSPPNPDRYRDPSPKGIRGV